MILVNNKHGLAVQYKEGFNMKYNVSFATKAGVYCSNIVEAVSESDIMAYYESEGYTVIAISNATDGDIREAERKGKPFVTIEHTETEETDEAD